MTKPPSQDGQASGPMGTRGRERRGSALGSDGGVGGAALAGGFGCGLKRGVKFCRGGEGRGWAGGGSPTAAAARGRGGSAMERARESKPLRRKALAGGNGWEAPAGDGGGGSKKPKFVSIWGKRDPPLLSSSQHPCEAGQDQAGCLLRPILPLFCAAGGVSC